MNNDDTREPDRNNIALDKVAVSNLFSGLFRTQSAVFNIIAALRLGPLNDAYASTIQQAFDEAKTGLEATKEAFDKIKPRLSSGE